MIWFVTVFTAGGKMFKKILLACVPLVFLSLSACFVVPPAYTELRTFAHSGDCRVPLVVDSNVPNRNVVKAAFKNFSGWTGYRFVDASHADAAKHGVRIKVEWKSQPYGGIAIPTNRPPNTTWVIEIVDPNPSKELIWHEGGHVFGLAHVGGTPSNIMNAGRTDRGATWAPEQLSQLRAAGRRAGC